jgi:hypothetical protein
MPYGGGVCVPAAQEDHPCPDGEQLSEGERAHGSAALRYPSFVVQCHLVCGRDTCRLLALHPACHPAPVPVHPQIQ